MIEDFYVSLTRRVQSIVKNDSFEPVPTYTNSTIDGYIGSRSSFEEIRAGKWVTRDQYKFFSSTECKYGDLILFNNETYRIVADAQNTININHHYKSFLEKIENVD